MWKFLISWEQQISVINTWLGKGVSGAILVIIGMLLWETFSRYALARPTAWATELSVFIFGGYIMLGTSYTLLQNRHIRMDIFYSRFSEKERAIIDICTFPLMAFYLGVILWAGITAAEFAVRFNQVTNSMWRPPIAPIIITVLVGTLMLLLQGVGLFIRDLSIVFRKEKRLP